MKSSILPVLLLAVSLGTPALAQEVGWLVDNEEPTGSIDRIWYAANGDITTLQSNADGQALWANAYYVDTTASEFQMRTVEVFPDGSAVLIGPPWSIGGSTVNFLVVRINSDGSVAWSRTVRTMESLAEAYYSFTVAPLSQGKTLVVATGNMSRVFRFTMDAGGQVLEASVQPSPQSPTLEAEVHVNDADEVTLVLTSTMSLAPYYSYVARFSSSGETQWCKSIRLINGNWTPSFAKATLAMDGDENAYVFGVHSGPGLSTTYPYLIKMTSTGTLDWYRLYGTGSYTAYTNGSGRQAPDGSLLFGTTSINAFSTSGEHLANYRTALSPPMGTPDSIQWQGGVSAWAGGDSVLTVSS